MARFAADQRGLRAALKGPTGQTGVAGPTGATGNGAVFQAVDSLHASPRSVTDWGSVINTALGNGITHFVFGAFEYQFNTPINVTFPAQGVVFEGSNQGIAGSPSNFYNGTKLNWTGTGSTAAITLGVVLPVMRDLSIYSTSNTFTGPLISTFSSFAPVLENLTIGTEPSPFAAGASCGVSLNGTIGPATLRNCDFGAQFSSANVRGVESGSTSNIANFYNVTFRSPCSFIINPHREWTLVGCCFEGLGNNANTHGITYDFAVDAGQITLYRCVNWDIGANASSCKLIYIPQNCPGIQVAVHDFRDEASGAYQAAIHHQGQLGSEDAQLTVIGGNFMGPIICGNAAAVSNERKRSITIIGCNVPDNGIQQADTGHREVTVLGIPNNSGGTNGRQAGMFTVRHERTVDPTDTGNKPTVTVHSSAPVGSAITDFDGTDMAGHIQFTAPNAGVSAQTDVVLVTFSSAWHSARSGATTAGTPSIVLSPRTLSFGGGATNQFYDAQVMAVPIDETSWKVTVQKAMTGPSFGAGGWFAVDYRVIMV